MAGAWTKETAIAELKTVADATRGLAREARFNEEHALWWAKTLRVLEEVFGQHSRYYLSVAQLPFYETGAFIIEGGPWNIEEERRKRHQLAYERDLGSARGLLRAAVEHLESTDLDSVYQGKDTPPESSVIVKVINLAEHKLRKTVRGTPTGEKEIQDAFENLLIGADLKYSRETERIEYSSKTYTPDFTMRQIDLAIEIKFCARAGREKELIAEINDDILAYQTRYGNQLFVVYDVGMITDIDRFADSFEQHQNVVVRVVKH